MKKQKFDLQLGAIFLGGLLFNFLFWDENFGLNLLLYSLFILLVLFTDQKHYSNKKTMLVGASHLLAALLVVYNQSDLSIVAYYISLVVFVGYAHAPLIRATFTAIFAGFLQLLAAPFNLIVKLINVKIGNYSVKPILKPIKYIVIPVIVFFFFTVLYSNANPVFENYLSQFSTAIDEFFTGIFTFIFGDLSINRLLHLLLGILFTAGILLAFKESMIEKLEAKLPEDLIRKRNNSLLSTFAKEIKDILMLVNNKKMALKTENIVGIISFAALNLLLLFLNLIDISTLWFGNLEHMADKNYSAELHDGTNALIFSIVMAMAVILYFFNGNLNFFSKNKSLKMLAFLWIAQNAFLVCSVCLRDYQYIMMHGLTYKRIGVLVFLTLCSIGLATVYFKVAKRKTFFFLYKTNGISWYVLLLAFSFVNWDVVIVKYNIDNRKSITLDLDHLVSMSDKTLPLLIEHKQMLRNYLPLSSYSVNYGIDDSTAVEMPIDTTTAKPVIIDQQKLKSDTKTQEIAAFEKKLANEVQRFISKWNSTSWLSWNYRDWQTHQYLEKSK